MPALIMGRMDVVITRTLSSVILGAPTTCESITMFPLLGPPDVETAPSYLTLDQAIGGRLDRNH